MASKADFFIDQGSDYAIQLELIDAETKGAKNLVAHTVVGQVKKTFTSDSDNTWDFASAINDPEGGVVTISLTNAQTDSMKAGRYVYDVELSFVDSDLNTVVERILEGTITITPSVTR